MLIIDSFAGGGGASTGIEMALGRSPDIAINHDETALAMHEANHPGTIHITENVWKVNIDDYTKGEPVGLLWASPDCRHFSKARGGAPTSKSVRGLAWSVVKFCRQLGRNRPTVILMENVDEFQTWEDYPAWHKAMKLQGYKSREFKLKACDFGAPTIRTRLFIVFRRDGLPIKEPAATHAPANDSRVLAGQMKPYRTAAEIIDWSIPCPSIFDTSEEIKRKHGLRAVRPLADNTQRRIAAGIKRYVLDEENPFFVTYAQQGGKNRSALDPLQTITASSKDQNCVVVPTLSTVGYGERRGQRPRYMGVHKPLGTVVAGGGKHALVSAFLAQYNTCREGVNPGRSAKSPFSTITGRGTQQQVVACHLSQYYSSNNGNGGDLRSPLGTVTTSGNHAALVAAFMVKYYGTAIGQNLNQPCHSVTTKDRMGLVTVSIDGTPYTIVDIGMRMLTPRELFNAQGFPETYEIDARPDGRPFTKTEKTHKCGNSVSPYPAAALVEANCDFLRQRTMAA